MVQHSFQTTNQTIVFDDVAYTVKGNYTLDVYRKNSNTSIVFTHSDATTFLAEYQKYLEYKANLSAATLEAVQTTIAINKLMQEQLADTATNRVTGVLSWLFNNKPTPAEIQPTKAEAKMLVVIKADSYADACEIAESISFQEVSEGIEFKPSFYWDEPNNRLYKLEVEPQIH